MTKKPGNIYLKNANKAKNDEFYTQLPDIEKELRHYKEHFEGKIIFCNCDDPEESNFFKYFALNFEYLGLKKIISTHFKENETTYKLEITRGLDLNNDNKIDLADVVKTPLTQNGDFRSPEAIEILKSCDIVVTNPPFSLFREYVAQLFDYNKKFIILGNINAITYKEIFPLIQENKLWTGYGFNMSMVYRTPYENTLEANRKFVIQKGYNPKNHIKVPAVCWYTNLEIQKRYEDIILYKTYKGNESNYPKYDNYNAININKVVDIPLDYDGAMGVPITFLDKYNPKQFNIIGRADANISNENNIYHISGFSDKGGAPLIHGKFIYKRILIKNKKPLLS